MMSTLYSYMVLNGTPSYHAHSQLAAKITRAASKQTYFTVRFLVDGDRIDDAYRAYAYFRWVDDQLDEGQMSGANRQAFIMRQSELVERLSRGELVPHLLLEECLLADLIHPDRQPGIGLLAYIRHLMAVMVFDAERQGRLISTSEMENYTYWLAAGVTEALHYFIGNRCGSPQDESRYQAATGAHIAHMLRDTLDDVDAGYFNIPLEVINASGITAHDVQHASYKDWVKQRVGQARECFQTGRLYLSQVKSFRCRLAGYAYIARFETVLDAIERDDFLLRRDYPECKTLTAGIRTCLSTLSGALRFHHPIGSTSHLSVMED